MDWFSYFFKPVKANSTNQDVLDKAADAILNTPLPANIAPEAQADYGKARVIAADLIRSDSEQARINASQLLVQQSDSLAVIENLCL